MTDSQIRHYFLTKRGKPLFDRFLAQLPFKVAIDIHSAIPLFRPPFRLNPNPPFSQYTLDEGCVSPHNFNLHTAQRILFPTE